jgi:Uma2 family endonuclease
MAITTPVLTQGLTLEQFLSLHGDDDRLELIDGEVVDLEPTGSHEQVAALLSRKLNVAMDRLDLPYFIPHRCLIQTFSLGTALRPDVVVLDQLEREPLWRQEPVITLGDTVQLVAEVVSTNWQNDYARKFEEYEALGVTEYWIVDYRGLGGKYYIGLPKQPTVTQCCLRGDSYERRLFRRGEVLVSEVIPGFELAVDALFAYGVR